MLHSFNYSETSEQWTHLGAGFLSVVARLSLPQRLTGWPHPQLLIGFNAEECGLQDTESANLDQTRSERAKIDKTKEWTDYLSNKCRKFDLILMICARGFGLCPLSEVILYHRQK